MAPKAAPKRKAPAKRALAECFPAGEILTDTVKKSWKLGTPVGQGGFGLLYLAGEGDVKVVGADASYVIKVEPSENGPLFSELKFYMRAAKPELIQGWMKAHKLKYLGVPRYWGSGLHKKGTKSYRFMVMDRFGLDLQKIFEERGKKFPRKLVLQLGLRLIDILEYIHEHEYVHADIKASNLLVAHKNPNQVYLVDYGLAYRYSPEGVPKEYKADPKRCHDGTIEFTSIDAHNGASPSRRGDLEILAYCMLQWLCGRLPWEDNLKDPLYVSDPEIPIRCRDNIRELMSKCFPSDGVPDEMVKFMEEVKSLDYTDKPNYQKFRSILQGGLKSIGASDDDKLDFASVDAKPSRAPVKKAPTKRKRAEEKVKPEPEPESESEPEPDRIPSKKVARIKGKEVNGVKKATPKKKLVEMGTQTSPGPANVKRGRGRPKKTA
ncbi:serine/threonine-protein kinase VRK1-like [Brienomyrus brachyistius]|uniref:serine/threonine-protein kinase VRK1-like n=1 Tax=Brienomyrus brachyistius TaxID=42636 RepID=UPI0020B2E34D|nr:serine/threonine-protein kinase VRK1-like [Brienomyrus brachyistius]